MGKGLNRSSDYPKNTTMVCVQTTLNVRFQRSTDWDKLREMYLECDEICMGIPSDYVDVWLKCLADGISVVAELGDKIVGHAVVTPLNDREVSLCVYVRKGYRSKGIGTRLVKFLIDKCREMGFEKIRIVTEKNRAVEFFKRLGFRFVRAGYGYEMVLPLRT